MLIQCRAKCGCVLGVKTIVACLVAVAIISFASIGYCDSGFLDGFRGIIWSTAKDDLPDLALSKKTLKNIYKTGPSAIMLTAERTNLDMHVAGAPLLSIFLRFNDQLFYGYDLVFKPQHAKTIQAYVEKELGASGKEVDGELHWETGGVSIILTDRELMVEKR